MSRFRVRCTNVHCLEMITIDEQCLHAHQQMVDIVCPSCLKTMFSVENKNFAGRQQTLVKVTKLDQDGGIQGWPEHLGWLIDLKTNKSYALKTGNRTFGRVDQRNSAEVCIDNQDPTISAVHCEITCQVKEGRVYFTIQDCDSTNGTFLNGRKMSLPISSI